MYCVATVAHCRDGSVYKRVFYCYFGVKMRECISLGGKGAFWLDLIISINHTLYGFGDVLVFKSKFLCQRLSLTFCLW